MRFEVDHFDGLVQAVSMADNEDRISLHVKVRDIKNPFDTVHICFRILNGELILHEDISWSSK